MASTGKIAPNSMTGAKNVATYGIYAGNQIVSYITANSNTLALNFGGSTGNYLPASKTTAPIGSFYGGSGIILDQTAGQIDRNILMFTGNSGSGGTTPNATITLNNSNVNCIGLITGVQAAAVTYTNSNWVAIGNRLATNPGANSVQIGPISNSGGASGNTSMVIGSSSVAAGINGIAIGTSCSAAGGSSIAIGNTASAGGSNISLGLGVVGTGVGSLQITGSGMTMATNNGSHLQHIGYQLNVSTPASTINASTAIGVNSTIDMSNTLSFAAGSFGAVATGNSQIMFTVGRMQTTNNTATEIGLVNAGTNAQLQSLTPAGFITLTNNSTYIFNCDIIARVSPTGTDYSAWNLTFCVAREAAAANTSIVGTPISTVIGQTAGAISGAWAVAVTADTTNGRPAIKVTGATSTTINWVMNARITKVGG